MESPLPPPVPTPEEAPKFAWYEWVWMGWPMVLLVVGGLVGGLCGAGALTANQKVFRATANPFLRCLFSGLISVGAVAVYFAVAMGLVSVMR